MPVYIFITYINIRMCTHGAFTHSPMHTQTHEVHISIHIRMFIDLHAHSHTHVHTQNYIVAHINELQALVVVDHASGQNNLYLSDLTGVYFSLSLPDIVTGDSGLDLEKVSIKCMHVHMYIYFN